VAGGGLDGAKVGGTGLAVVGGRIVVGGAVVGGAVVNGIVGGIGTAVVNLSLHRPQYFAQFFSIHQ